ncbi:M50 family metallopeptidase [Streptomyces sp. NPDC001262]|uniref:M50 family metallopeptidase n=1 Tax=Streptomyces sp. NPDC001262 TaxID=3364552 RepID=UPI0036B7DA47
MSWLINRVRRTLQFDTDQYNEWVAVHEVGHAVSSLVLGRRVRYIELNRSRDGLVTGGVTKAAHSRDPRVMPSFHAGIEAQEIWMRHHRLWTPQRMDIVRSSSRHDLDVIQRVTPDTDEQQAHHHAAHHHVAHHWPLVQRMATALLENGRLSARDISRL